MAGGKETPRQRMIGILYLVLLGLIALNVPDSLLDAFRNITNSLDKSRANVTTGIQNTYSAFEQTKLKEQPERAKPIYDRAKQASKIAEDLNNYIESLKATLIKEGGGINPTINDVDARDNLDISPRVMVEQKNADKLRKMIDETRDKLINILPERERQGVNFSLNAIDPPKNGDVKKSWQEANFGDGIPLGAALTTLAKIQADAKNAENEVVKKILGEVDQAVVNLDKFSAVAVAPSSYVIAGQPYTAEVFLTASDSKSSPDISVNGNKLAVQDGKGKYSVSTGSEGTFTWVGTIRVRQNDGTYKEYKTTPQTYQVARPSAVVSPDKMNVLYIGVDNPLSVSAPGVAKENLKVSMSGGSISGSNGHYVAKVSSIGTAKVTVTGDKGTVLGTSTFRVKRIPDPKAMFAGKSGGSTSAANIRGQDRLFARLDNFDFDAKFNVTRFTLIVIKPRQDAMILTTSGGELSGAMRAATNTVTPGSTVVFKDIVAVGPDGTQRGLDAIVLTAN
ncbi:gliding motility protein GldM [Mucilaginibacter litoreus]|uniref:Gliding motility protein GldM n=1 Tax=Mucilaginibacter litoreus TaxID=1048221 RepID=A0ABW3AQP0_9SPHI